MVILDDNCKRCCRIDKEHCAGSCNSLNPFSTHVKIIINTGHACNLKCDYCYNKNIIDKGSLSEHDIDILFEKIKCFSKTSFSFDFIGGEPTLFPDIIEYVCYKSILSYNLLDVRIYSNGYIQDRRMYDINNKYHNISYIISHNYPIILDEGINSYCKDAILYVNYDDTKEIVFKKLSFIKALGYKNCKLNFDILYVPDNIDEYIKNMSDILVYCHRLMDKDFNLQNFNTYGLKHKNSDLVLNYFADNNFYASHIKNSEPIQNILTCSNNITSFNKCRNCNYYERCNHIYSDADGIVINNLSTHCVNNIINTTAIKRYKND